MKVLHSSDEQLFGNLIAQQDSRIGHLRKGSAVADAMPAVRSIHNQCQSPANSANSPWSNNGPAVAIPGARGSHFDSGTTGPLHEYDGSNSPSCSYHMNGSSIDSLPNLDLISIGNDDSCDRIRHMPHHPIECSYSDGHRTGTQDGTHEFTLDFMNIYEHYDSSTCDGKDITGGVLFNPDENQSPAIPQPPAHPPRGDDAEDDSYEPFQTSLHIGAERGHVSMVSMLLLAGAPVDALDSGANTALHRATRSQQLGAIRLLLEHGADPNHANAMGWTPVHLGVSAGSTGIVELLVQHGGDLAKKAKIRDYSRTQKIKVTQEAG
ncbi:ankyrin repeat-containing domain protein [Xylaria digitata]|nr:ankyrin repeat-containing domain protein [Xylaria digitata]